MGQTGALAQLLNAPCGEIVLSTARFKLKNELSISTFKKALKVLRKTEISTSQDTVENSRTTNKET